MRTSLVAMSLLICLAAAAQEAADVHLLEGVKAFNAKDYVKASEELSISLREHPVSKTALFLGNAYLKLDQLGKAKEALELALKLDPSTKKRDTIVKLIQIMGSRNVGIVKITSTPPGATIRIDGETDARGKAPIELSLAPGTHKLLAELDGFQTASEDRTVESGQPASIDFTLRTLECELSIAVGPSGSQVVVDRGAPVALPVTLRVPTGPHTITLTAVAHEKTTENLNCDGYTPISIQAAWTPSPILMAPVSPNQVKSKAPRRRWVWAVVGTSAGVVVAGVVIGAVLGSRPHDPTPTVGSIALGLGL